MMPMVPSNKKTFHGIPWNLERTNFDSTSSSIEFHGTWSAPISMTRAVPIPWNSMELVVHQFRWHEQLLGIPLKLVVRHFPWDCSCHRNWRTLKFHGTACVSKIGTMKVPWNSMEIYARVIEIAALQVPWNSMELLVSTKLAHSKSHGIPWNSMELLVIIIWKL